MEEESMILWNELCQGGDWDRLWIEEEEEEYIRYMHSNSKNMRLS